MSCLVNNPNCVDGWVKINGVVEEKPCECVRIRETNVAYKFANAEPYLKHFLKDLKGNPNVMNIKTGTIKPYQDFAKTLIDNLPSFIDDSIKMFITGVPECGKSQLANTLVLEAADKHRKLSYYLSASDFCDAVFDYKNPERLQKIFEKVRNKRVEILILDDMGAELPNADDKRIDELIVKYNLLVREFYKKSEEHKGLLLITSNFGVDKFKTCYKSNQRLFSMIFQEGSTAYYTVSSDAQFRQKKVADSLGLLD